MDSNDYISHFGSYIKWQRAMYEYVFLARPATGDFDWEEMIYSYYQRELWLTFAIVDLAKTLKERSA